MILRYLLSSLFTDGSPNVGRLECLLLGLGEQPVKIEWTTNYEIRQAWLDLIPLHSSIMSLFLSQIKQRLTAIYYTCRNPTFMWEMPPKSNPPGSLPKFVVILRAGFTQFDVSWIVTDSILVAGPR